MSQENVDLVQRVMAASQHGEMSGLRLFDQEIEWRLNELPATDLEPVYRGHEGVRTFWRTWAEAWETPSFEYEEFIDAGDTVVSILSQRVRGRTSGIELQWTSYGQNWTVQDGKVVLVQFFPTRAKALASAGLTSSA